jgi:hypothetical protein
MATDFEFISPDDKPALLGLSSPEWLAKGRSTLTELDYKTHVASNQDDFLVRFNRTRYHIALLEESFAVASPAHNIALVRLMQMPMSQRRHAVIFLLGDRFQTLNPLQAFQFSVHAVVNRSEIDKLKPIVQQTVAEHDLFLQIFRDAQLQITAWGK